ncbi:MAG TPA: hypothetical protein VGH54_09755 [Mycobacterium sp.]|uniref:hypothetical protein n=1 Tax=Mycobacterium sp. TaxID=1785 RepID=UPI002F4248E4
MSAQCTHPRTGVVTSGPWTAASGSHAATNVCDRPECIAEATAWVERVTRRPAIYRRDEKAEVPA